MPAKQRRLAVALIDGFYEKAKDEGENATPWILNNVLELIKHVALENIQQFRGCHLTTKIDPTVLIDLDPNVEIEAAGAESKRQQKGLICNYNFNWKPRFHAEAIAHETKIAADGSFLHAARILGMRIIGTSQIMLHSSMVQGQGVNPFWCQVHSWMLS